MKADTRDIEEENKGHTMAPSPSESGGGSRAPREDVAELGIEVAMYGSGLHVCKLLPNHPAATSGMIHEGDVITAFKTAAGGGGGRTKWRSTAGTRPGDAESMLSGPIGELIQLRIVRQGAQFDCTIELTRPWVPVDPSTIRR